jgi:hypothetical protein
MIQCQPLFIKLNHDLAFLKQCRENAILSGQEHAVHRDYIPFQTSHKSGPRILTVLIYLNTILLSSGGGTHFPRLNVTIQPEQGKALIFPLVLSQDLNLVDDRTEHETLLFDPSERQLTHSDLMVLDDDGQYA